MDTQQAEQIAEEMIALYQTQGGKEYSGEGISQLEHMVQSARLAAAQGYDDEVILAAFLHDVGHICVSAQANETMEGYGIKDHEEKGAAFLKERGFSKRVVRLVESHVEAKRYLTYKYPEYADRLSEASRKTLEYQGGKMSQDEADAFENYPLFDLIISMRRWDEDAKIKNMPVPNLDEYKLRIIQHLKEQ